MSLGRAELARSRRAESQSRPARSTGALADAYTANQDACAASQYDRRVTVDCRNPARHDHRFGQGARTPKERRMLIAVWLTITVMIGEVIVGLWSGSMALLADGVHMGTHTIALGVAWLAYVLTRRHASDRRFSFGTGKV